MIYPIIIGILVVAFLVVAIENMLHKDALKELWAQVHVQETVIKHQDGQLATMAKRMKTAETDADALAAVVRDNVRIATEIAKMMGETAKPPVMAMERSALEFHDRSLQLRPGHQNGPTSRTDKAQ